MALPEAVSRIYGDLQDRIEDAERAAERSHAIFPNSYGAGYDSGYRDALKELSNSMTWPPELAELTKGE